MRTFEWGASIAVSWLWGLGLFFSWHFAALYGPVGLLVFAVPNALGLLVFGLMTARLARGHDLAVWAEDAMRRYAWVFFAYQLIAVSLTLFALAKYLLAPMGVSAPFLVATALLFLACATAERFSLEGLVRVHAVVLVGLAAAFCAMAINWPAASTGAAEMAPRDASFLAFTVPIALGLLLGPWLDLQQWQRAVHLARQNRSIAKAFAAGSCLFLLLLLANGSLAIWSRAGVTAASAGIFDRYPHAEAAFATFAADNGSILFKAALLAWAIGAVFTTFDSSRLAVSWFNDCTIVRSQSLLVGLLPEGARKTTAPFFALCVLVAGLGLAIGIDLEYFMTFYASLFLAYSAVLFREAATGQPFVVQSPVFALGIASTCLLAGGYLADDLVFVVAAPLVAVSSCWLLGRDKANPAPRADGAAAAAISSPPQQSTRTESPPDRVAATLAPTPAIKGSGGNYLERRTTSDGWFNEEKWFHIHIIPTYGDTNSVGNVYFSTYVNWIGKTRELFFRACMPNFDLKVTPFFILTRNFQHKFVRETREFEELFCRLKIRSYNRKFVELQHEIRDKASKLIGEGSQTLMFVDSANYRLIDIPEPVMTAFLPLAPGAAAGHAVEVPALQTVA